MRPDGVFDNGLYHVRIERVNGSLTDHYDPRSNVIRLSDSVYSQTSTAAIGVAAHEAGHAIQYAQHYIPIRLRNAIIPITNCGLQAGYASYFNWSAFCRYRLFYGNAGLCGCRLLWFFHAVPAFYASTEFDASRRAIRADETCGILSSDEIYGSKKVLTAAALTYVAALAVSLMQLLRLLNIVNRRNNN